MDARILLYDEFSPEDVAMLQALYSRSPQSAAEHAAKVRSTGSGKFMETFYVGYSHKSIGDCGTTTLFFEGVSELAAKAIQDWPLYSGQQTSTRYIDFANQPLVDPLGTPESGAILAAWMRFYTERQEAVVAHLAERFPCAAGDDPRQWEKAIRARGFDVLRAFLPAGVSTQLSWHTNLRQAADKLVLLLAHPLPEVRDLAAGALAVLRERYPHSFTLRADHARDEYTARAVASTAYLAPDDSRGFVFTTTVDPQALVPYAELLAARPAHAELPVCLEELGQVGFSFELDYGSFRDLQRHRHGVIRMPLLVPDQGFHAWYLEQLPEAIRRDAESLVAGQSARVAALDADSCLKQYYLALGYQVTCRVTMGLPAAVYVAELRSGATVHPTLRTVAQRMLSALAERFPMLVLHGDPAPDRFSLRRGSQDIVERAAT